MMKPHFVLRTLRPLSRTFSAGTPSTPRFTGFHGAVALVIVGLAFAAAHAIAQDPSPIPNWSTEQPNTMTGQYPSNQQGQGQQSQYPPQYQQEPAYGQQANPQQ